MLDEWISLLTSFSTVATNSPHSFQTFYIGRDLYFSTSIFFSFFFYDIFLHASNEA